MFPAFRSALVATAILSTFAHAATFGRLTSVRGTVSDLAVDETRGVIYAANYTASRVEVINLATGEIQNALTVPAQPSALSLAVDGRFLAVTHASTLPGAFNGITIIDLNLNRTQTIATAKPALTVAFGIYNLALVATTDSFLLLNPYSATGVPLLTQLPAVMEQMPVPAGTMPLNVTWAASGVSADSAVVFAVVDNDVPDDKGSSSFIARLDLTHPERIELTALTAAPPLGPRVVSVNHHGDRVLAGWGLLRWSPRFMIQAQLPNIDGRYHAGSHAIDTVRNVIYANAGNTVPDPAGAVLHVLHPDNLAVLDRIRIPQALAGRSVITRDGGVMASVSQSGVIVFDLARLHAAPRVAPAQEDILFNTGFCDRRVVRSTVDIVDPKGGATDFSISASTTAGLRVFPTSGITPAQITIEVDPAAFTNKQGTTAVTLDLKSNAAINVPPSLRVLINTRDTDQKGGLINIPGRLTDILTDPYRPRFYVIRQDRNLVLVYNSANLQHIASMPTGNTPVQMAMTSDAKYLIVGNDNSQFASVLNLETLQAEDPIEAPIGLYPRSVAAAGDQLLATARAADGGNARVLKLDIVNRVATAMDSLGIYCNEIHPDSALVSSPSSGTVLLAQPGTVSYKSCPATGPAPAGNPPLLLYETASGTFVTARADLAAPITGAYAALSDDYFLVDKYLLDKALVPNSTLSTAAGRSSGALGLDNEFFRVSALSTGPGFLERIPYSMPDSPRAARLTESPITVDTMTSWPVVGFIGRTVLGFSRTLAYSPYPRQLLLLSTSGITAIPPDFDAAMAAPTISAIVNAADSKPGVAPGGLIRIQGSSLSAATESAGGSSWPSLLGGACVTINSIPIPLSRVSPSEITGQLPFAALGTGAVTVRSSNGVSNIYSLKVLRTAPAIFQLLFPQFDLVVPMVVRAANGEPVTYANPIHAKDEIEIYFTGGGLVNGPIQPGSPSPAAPAGSTLASCTLTLGEETLEVSSCALVPGSVGVYRAVASVPWFIKSGNEVPLVVSLGDAPATASVRVLGK